MIVVERKEKRRMCAIKSGQINSNINNNNPSIEERTKMLFQKKDNTMRFRY